MLADVTLILAEVGQDLTAVGTSQPTATTAAAGVVGGAGGDGHAASAAPQTSDYWSNSRRLATATAL